MAEQRSLERNVASLEADVKNLPNWQELVSSWIAESCRLSFLRFPQLRRWEMTGDVAQQATLSLLEAINSKKVSPTSEEHLRRIVVLHVKWTFLRLARQHRRSIRTAHATPVAGDEDHRPEESHPSELTPASRRVDWMLFHCTVDNLPDLQREIFQKSWYDEMKKSEIADQLGLSIRTVQRNYRLACDQLICALGDFDGLAN
ncbi:sigma-70 family RNA polymerase sigma factor [Stieleria sp. JC731]|uniref:sigma-70 family RNA polymerase sigma factor n=1 Tax=Pirellulaceae TaxID=2691357 RepID=UPI001E39E2F8|nr:sigma-70 family RNA polymerase sigma factor [Stieleria sp. JC731]MCC9603400.1 sigma-70 family RNA polymerase sigma factor [Stieleria sp. JC731]